MEAVLSRAGFIKIPSPNGSHCQYKHPVLKKMVSDSPKGPIVKEYGPGGQIAVIRHGNTVYGYILKRILGAINIINDYEDHEAKKRHIIS